MIKNLLISTFIALTFFCGAQQLTNPGFENWSSGNPTGWGSVDEMLSGTGLVSGTTLESQVSPGYSGNSACQLKTQTVNIFLAGSFDLPGAINSGPMTIDLANFIPNLGRVPYTAMPSGFSFYYKYLPTNIDTASARCFFTKWNTSTNKRDTVGSGGTYILGTTTSFTMKTVSVVWFNSIAPDSMQLSFVSSFSAAPQINTTLIIDDINMIVPIGMNEYAITPVKLFPNPASDIINFSVEDGRPDKVEIFDGLGNLVTSDFFNDNQIKLNTENIPIGVYYFRITDKDLKVLNQNRFVISR